MKKLAYLLPLLVLALVVAPAALAQAPVGGIGTAPAGGTNIGETGPVQDTATLVDTILGLINWVAWFVALVAVLFGLYAGILFITAGGNEETLSKAKNILLYAIVGIVVAILAFSIVAISRSIVNF
jgi:hypothetical protein